MLTTQSYMAAFAIYIAAALIALWVFRGWLPGRWPAGVRWGAVAFVAGMLLAPAYPGEGATTLAPALIIVVFNTLFGDGWTTAVPAAAVLLAAMMGGGIAGALLGALLGRAPREAETGSK